MAGLDSKHLKAAMAPMRRRIRAAEMHSLTNHKNKKFSTREAYEKWRDARRRGDAT